MKADSLKVLKERVEHIVYGNLDTRKLSAKLVTSELRIIEIIEIMGPSVS